MKYFCFIFIIGNQCNGNGVDGGLPNIDSLSEYTWQQLVKAASKVMVNLQNNQGNTTLHLAAWAGNTDLTTALLARGADVSISNKDGQTVLFFCREEHTAKILLENGASVNHRDKTGSTCLHTFCSKPELSLDLIHLVLTSDGHVDARNYGNQTPTMLSSMAGDLTKVDFLLQNGAQCNLTDKYGRTLVHHAVQSRNLELVKYLVLKHNMPVNAVDTNRTNPLHIATSTGELDLVTFLLLCDADVNAKDKTGKLPTAYAIKSGNVEVLDCLLSHGAIVADTSQGATSPLHLFSIRGDLGNVRKLVEQGFDLQKPDENERSALHCALLAKHFDVADYLLSKRAKAGTIDAHHSSPLHTAAMHCPIPQLFQKLVSSGAQINLRNAFRQNALHLCVLHNTNVEVLRTVLDLGADPNLEDSRGFVPLQHVIRRFTKLAALESTNKESADLLDWVYAFFEVEGQVDANCADSEGKTCVHYTAENGQPKLLQVMLENGGHPDILDKFDRSPLHCACERGHAKCVNLLLKFGSSLDVFDSYGNTPLIYAVKCGSYECVEQLLGKGADLELTKNGILPPLLLALAAKHVEIAELLLMNAADVSVSDKTGRTALHYASQYTTQSIVENILSAGADVNCRDQVQMCPIHMAAQNPDVNVLRKILNENASVNAQDKWGNTALHVCSERGSYSHVDLLLSNGADIEISNSQSQTALHFAVKAEEPDVLELLIANEAEVNVLDNNKQTPLLIALSSGNAEAANILLDQGCDVTTRDNMGQSALHKVARMKSHRPSIIQSLIKKGLNPVTKDMNGQSAIDMAEGTTANLLLTLQAEKMAL